MTSDNLNVSKHIPNQLFVECRKKGAVLVDNLDNANISKINSIDEVIAMLAEFKISVNNYLEELESSPVRSLSDVIAFNKKNSDLVRTD